MHKDERQDYIVRMIKSGNVASQQELTEGLAAVGTVVTQASISRDLDELGVVKRDGVYTIQPRNVVPDLGNVEFEMVGDHLVVAKCSAGLASAITVMIDASYFPGIAGTIAGDDTIFIAIRDGHSGDEIVEKIDSLLGIK